MMSSKFSYLLVGVVEAEDQWGRLETRRALCSSWHCPAGPWLLSCHFPLRLMVSGRLSRRRGVCISQNSLDWSQSPSGSFDHHPAHGKISTNVVVTRAMQRFFSRGVTKNKVCSDCLCPRLFLVTTLASLRLITAEYTDNHSRSQ